ncbi:hypothetical protein NDU88_002746 [Pleurodeles waltl]|uniref:Uncharacterized protein n=1 Tax=Pleurodeles waltl TaxID=8319 RepID=A0AAV7KSY4_PLEWA|nr:hypothetical protein NDU88_002746 [Pleurodeles waltl]
MLNGKSAGKAASKPVRQLLFSEALQYSRPMATAKGAQPESLSSAMDAPKQNTKLECILQEILSISCRLEGMDSNISSLAEETKSIRTDIVGFQNRSLGLEQRVSDIEDHQNTTPDRDQEILCLRSKLIDIEDRSHRDNVRFFRILELAQGADIHAYLQNTLSTPQGLSFDPPLECRWHNA